MSRQARIGWIPTWIALAALGPGLASAQTQQLYFVAFGAPLGSLSSPGATTPVTYLRWDALEGSLHRDLASFRLERVTGDTREVLLEEPIHAVKEAAQIAALYAGAAQDRRRREIIRWLDSEDAENPVGVGNFAQLIHQRINPALASEDDRAWAHFASRMDFNVARARYRAYIDDAPGSHRYELVGVSEDGAVEVRLGHVAVAAPAVQVMPRADGFQQVEISRCDAPERFKDHGALALTWDHGATTPTDRFATSILIAGYDLFCTEANVGDDDPPAERNLRQEAALVSHDAGGRLPLAGLVQLNDQPLTISGSAAFEQRYGGHNPPFTQLYLPAGDLEARGILPGDRRDCYLVARDITGNYGETAYARIEIPDRIPPPAPWDVRTVTRTAGNRFKLVWDHVDVRNYYEDFREERVYCNLATARFDARLDFVPEGEVCEDRPPVSVDLDVREYLIYRFDDASQAAAFRDSDGDGYADAEERRSGRCDGGSNADESCQTLADCPDQSSGASCDVTGTACKPDAAPPDATNRLLATVELENTPLPPGVALESRPSGRRVMELSDLDPAGPAGRKGDVFWYRIAARDGERELSLLSAPVRGFFPERTPPERSELDPCVFGFLECSYHAEVLPAPNPLLPFAIDRTREGLTATGEAGCPRSNISGEPFELVLHFEDFEFGRGAELTGEGCQALWQHCGNLGSDEAATVAYFDEAGELLGEALYPGGFSEECPPPNSVLEEDCDLEAEPGQVLAGPPTLDCSGIELCVDIRHEIAGESFRWKTVCPGGWPVSLEVPHLGPGEIRFSIVTRDENNVPSAERDLPPIVLESDWPAPPQAFAIRFEAESERAQLVWRPPEEPVSGTFLEWRQDAEGVTETGFVAHEDAAHAPDGEGKRSEEISIPVSAEPEEWCFRARSLGRNGKVSSWSPSRCAVRLPSGEPPPQYLRWPPVEAPPVAGPLFARYLAGDGLPLVRLSSDPIELAGCDPGIDECRESEPSSSCFREANPDLPVHASCPDWCSRMRSASSLPFPFVAYRQSSDAGVPSEFHQVSPLVERAFCEPGFASGSPSLADPFVKLLLFGAGQGQEWEGFRLVFVDRTPHIAGLRYRYQLVFFDPRGEIASVRTSPWVGTGVSP
jgi:hypothetical protein